MADILTLAEARKALRKATADVADDTDLTGYYIPTATLVVEDIVGPVMQVAGRTFTVDGGKTQILLPSPAVSVEQVTETGVVLAAGTDYVVNLRAGIITRGTQLFPFVFLPGVQNVSASYTAGYALTTTDAKPHHKLGARIILAHMFQADQQGARPQFGAPDGEVVTTPSGFLVPRRAYEILKATPPVPGFA